MYTVSEICLLYSLRWHVNSCWCVAFALRRHHFIPGTCDSVFSHLQPSWTCGMVMERERERDIYIQIKSCRLHSFPPSPTNSTPRVVESKVLEMGFHIRQHLRVNLFRLLTSEGDPYDSSIHTQVDDLISVRHI